MKRVLVLALSVILALVVAAPVASGQTATQSQDVRALARDWWQWAVTNPSPLVGNYKGGQKCEGEFVEGVFFLAGTTGGDATRTCTVPADTALFFPVVNAVCGEDAPTQPEPEIPYTKQCADLIRAALAGGKPYATLDGDNLKMQRIASGPFTLRLSSGNLFRLPAGSYDAAADGLWVYLPEGLEPGEYTVQFGGDFPRIGFSLDITYKLIVV